MAGRIVLGLLGAPLLGVVSRVVPKPLNGVLRFILVLGRRRVRKGASKALRIDELSGPFAVVLDFLSGPATVLVFGKPVLRTLAPPVWRVLVFYRHMIPLLAGYFKTLKLDIPAAERRGATEEETQEIWEARHERGSEQMMALMEELKGFFLKVGNSVKCFTQAEEQCRPS